MAKGKKTVKIQVLNSLRGKYKLPYTTGHVVEMDEVRAKELIDNKDAQLYANDKEVVDPKNVSEETKQK